MMTYGWAILIIVIVAVILYSMGIFNPSSSVTFTSSGFSPFTISSALCNNLGLNLAVEAGPIPNNAPYLQIKKVFVTSSSAVNTTTASYSLPSPITLKSGQTANILVPDIACNTAKSRYTIAANLQYYYSAAGLAVNTNTTGTIAGTSISGKPSVITSYVPVSITNTQSSSIPQPFQQMVNITSLDSGWTDIASSPFGQNVEFFYYNGTIIPSWLENYTSNHALYWIKTESIPASSSITVYMGFAPTSTNLFNTVNVGEAPQLSATYGQYDDGANVFNFYDNFAGTSLPSGWAVYSGGGSYSVNNGLIVTSTSSSSTESIESPTFNSNPGIVEWLSAPFINSVSGDLQEGMGPFNCPDPGRFFYDLSPSSAEIFTGGSVNLQNNINNNIFGYVFNGTNSTFSFNYKTVDVTPAGNPYPDVFCDGNQNTGTSMPMLMWFRVRAYPPAGVMPSVTFGSVS